LVFDAIFLFRSILFNHYNGFKVFGSSDNSNSSIVVDLNQIFLFRAFFSLSLTNCGKQHSWMWNVQNYSFEVEEARSTIGATKFEDTTIR